MDKSDTLWFSRNVEMPICELSSWPWNIHLSVMGRSPSMIMHCTVIGWPAVSDPSPKLNGINCGATAAQICI